MTLFSSIRFRAKQNSLVVKLAAHLPKLTEKTYINIIFIVILILHTMQTFKHYFRREDVKEIPVFSFRYGRKLKRTNQGKTHAVNRGQKPYSAPDGTRTGVLEVEREARSPTTHQPDPLFDIAKSLSATRKD